MAVSAGELFVTLTLNAKDFIKNVGDAAQVNKDLEKSIQETGKATTELENKAKKAALEVGRVSKELAQNLGKAGEAITETITAGVSAFVSYGDSLNDISSRTGISVKVLGGLNQAAQMTGTSIETLEQGLKKLSINIDSANEKGGRQKKIFDELGVSLVDATGKAKTTDQVFIELSEAFRSMEDPVKKIDYAIKIFGKSGYSLIPMLSEGKQGIENYQKQAIELGKALDEKTAAAAARYDDSLVKLKNSQEGLSSSIGRAALPTLQALTDAKIALISKTTELINDYPGLSSVIAGVSGTVGVLFNSFSGVLNLAPSLKAMTDMLKLNMSDVASGIGKAAAAGGVFALSYTLTRQISEASGLNEKVQDLLVSSNETFESFRKFRDEKLFTEHGKQAVELRDRLQEIAQAIDPTVAGLSRSVAVISQNAVAYQTLTPELKNIVDRLSDVANASVSAREKMAATPEGLKENAAQINAVILDVQAKFNEATLSQYEAQQLALDTWYNKTVETLTKLGATEAQFLKVKEALNAQSAKIFAAEQKRRADEAKKIDEERKKEGDKLKKEEEERIKTEKAQLEEHFSFINGLRQQQQDLYIQQVADRGNIRDAELMRVQLWENAQLEAARQRYLQGQTHFLEFSAEITAIKETTTAKIEKIENDSRDRQNANDEKTVNEMRERHAQLWGNIENYASIAMDVMQKTFEAWTAYQEKRNEQRYASEVEKIKNSQLTQEEKEKAIAALRDETDKRNKALQEAAQKREVALAIISIIAETGIGVMKTIATVGWPAAIPGVIATIAMGTAQLLLLAAKANFGSPESYAPGETAPPPGGETPPGEEPSEGPAEEGGETPAEGFQRGTGGFIPVPRRPFFVGETTGGRELMQLRGPLNNVEMRVVPMTTQAMQTASQSGITLNVSISAIDASGIEEVFVSKILPLLNKYHRMNWSQF